jgi:hypothetical protein
LARATGLTLLEQDFEWLGAIPSGSGEGVYEGLRYGVTVAGGDAVSFNVCRLRSGEDSLRPREMPAEKVVALVLGYPAQNSF